MEGRESDLTQQYIKANNEYIKPGDKSKSSKYISYYDTKYLDGCAVAQY